MPNIIIRNYRSEDEAAVEEITFRTGYRGEDLTGRRYFDDKRLFFLIFIYYYMRYEPQHCFVAVENDNEAVVGFICGTPDTAAQQARFVQKMVPRIAFRTFLYTVWRYPRTFRTLIRMLKMWREIDYGETTAALLSEYPAHLHIDLLPEYQGRGLGTRLMRRFEEHMQSLNVQGIHLGTTNHNRKAVPFYRKLGFQVVQAFQDESNPATDELVHLTFAKKLSR